MEFVLDKEAEYNILTVTEIKSEAAKVLIASRKPHNQIGVRLKFFDTVVTK